MTVAGVNVPDLVSCTVTLGLAWSVSGSFVCVSNISVIMLLWVFFLFVKESLFYISRSRTGVVNYR